MHDPSSLSRRRARAAGLALLALLAISAGAAAQNAELVKDITPPGKAAPPGNLEAADFLVAGSKIFFLTSDGVWVTDGTAAGTELLGVGCSGCAPQPELLGSAGGLAFWRALGEDGWRLVRSDGTRAGTYRLTGPQGNLLVARDARTSTARRRRSSATSSTSSAVRDTSTASTPTSSSGGPMARRRARDG